MCLSANALPLLYTTALNYLLVKDSRQKIYVGDATTIFGLKRNMTLKTGLKTSSANLLKGNPIRTMLQ